MKFVPIGTHSHSSLLFGLPPIEKIVKYYGEREIPSLILTDTSMSEVVQQFSQANKAGIKPIAGAEVAVKSGELKFKVTLIAKNLEGYRELIKATHWQALTEFEIEDLIAGGVENLFCVVHGFDKLLLPSTVNFVILDKTGIRSQIIKDNFPKVQAILDRIKSAFADRAFVGITRFDKDFYFAETIADAAQYFADKAGIKTVAHTENYYLKKEDARDHRILISSNLSTTIDNLIQKMSKTEDFTFAKFTVSNRYYVPTDEEVVGRYTQEQLNNTLFISENCEPYSVLNNPKPPRFATPDGNSESEYLRAICREGWKRKIVGVVDKSLWPQYVNRLNYELKTIEEASILGYFCIVEDYVRYAKQRGILVGPGRGSAGGSLVAYLLDITDVDPIKYGLFFERFYNAGRNSPGKVSMPDIDVDFEHTKRHFVVDYIKNKYGHDKVMQSSTYSKLMGRGAITEVFRAHAACPFQEQKKITEIIPDKSKISDELEEMAEEGDERLTLLWALRNKGKELSDWVQIDDDDNITGRFAQYFEQALRLEGTKKSRGLHASGFIIGENPLNTVVPVIRNEDGDDVIDLQYTDAEMTGVLKADLLGLSALTRIKGVLNLMQGKRIEE